MYADPGPARPGLTRAFAAVLGLLALYLVTLVYAAGEALLAFACLAGFGLAFYVYLAKRAYAYRYMLPGLAGMAVFVVFPMIYTISIGFTNYSSPNHLLSHDRALRVLLDQTYTPEGASAYAFSLHADGGGFRIVLESEDGETRLVTPPVDLSAVDVDEIELEAAPLDESLGEPVARRDVIRLRGALDAVRVLLPDGNTATRRDLRTFASARPRYMLQDDDALLDQVTGDRLAANFETGFFERPDGERVSPGFRTTIGLVHFARIFTDSSFQGPFLRIFAWTVMFAGLSVLFTLAVGLTLACLLDWEALRGRKIYQTMLFLPYAVPAFISILVFRGLFNNNFGEINKILDGLFGISPQWFTDPLMAKTMILIVNTWLGYPYIMVLCMGLIKSIGEDLYEASAIEGLGPWGNFTHITAPLLIKPLTPLLIASFAFNFNNFVLIALLTGGRPDIIGAQVPAGTTDILVSYTYRIAFEDSGRDFGLAGAISTLIFVLVAIMAMVQIRMSKAAEAPS